jgi:hypothetical protein
MSEENSRKRFSLFKKKASKSGETKEEFDESSFSFELKSNNLNTCLIEACATMKKGINIGMPLPLKCTWYRATDEKEFVTIEGVTGAFYQPNADDIGCKICVHAVPVSEVEDYTGMPAFSEIGPLEIDPKLQIQIEEFLTQNKVEFKSSIVGVEKGGQNKPILLSLKSNIITIFNDENDQLIASTLSENCPKIIINYKSNNLFALEFEDTKFELNAENAAERDLIVITLRMFSSKAQSSDLAKIFLKNQQLSSRLFEVNKKYEQSLATINLLKDDAAVKIGDLAYYQNTFNELVKEHNDLKEFNSKIISQNENYNSEIIFLRKDLLVYKEQCSLLETKLENSMSEEIKYKQILASIKEDLEALTKRMVCGACKVDENLYIIIDRITGGNSIKKISSDTSSISSTQKDSLETAERERIEDSEIYSNQIRIIREEFSDFLNKAEAEKNFYKRKSESLAAENDKLLSKLGKNPKEISDFANQKQLFEETKLKLIKELEECKQKIQNYEKIIKANKNKLENEIERNFELRKLVQSKGMNSNADYQRIANCLTQTLTDREEELCKQKSLNKDFMKRIAELEAMIPLINN